AVNDIFSMPDILRTGPASRAELIAADETVTRVGANTIFSFDPATRTIDLKQGSLLFHSPHGKGGGTIHTGSATASVLGTTLIVTTTPTGGMKVLDLEGNVEVKFLNGLKQNLDPGHMTMVMPGGNQLSPIIVFRLDDLTKNSQLVKGFNGSLSSMPLIQQQIDKQLKAIQSGKLSDTGLILDANGQPIQQIDGPTLSAAINNSGFNSAKVNAALAADATINGSLSDPSIPIPPARIFLKPKFILLGNAFYTGQGFKGFAARNIFFNTINLQPLSVDLSQFVQLNEFDFVAAGNLALDGSVNFNGLSANKSIFFNLVGGNGITVAPGSTIRADVANFGWQSPTTVTLDGVSVYNGTGNTDFGTGAGLVLKNNAYLQAFGNLTARTVGNISLANSTVTADSIIMNSAQGTVDLGSSVVSVTTAGIFTGDQGVTVNNSSINADGQFGHVAFNTGANHGSVNISGTSISTAFFAVNSGDGITLDGADQSLNIGNMNLAAVNTANINNANLGGVAYLNVIAKTITVQNTSFNAGRAYNFGTSTGQVNVNNGVSMGRLNLISDSIGNVAITSASQVDVTSGPSTAAGIHSYSTSAPAPKPAVVKVTAPPVVRTPAVSFASTR
ncbi:MAG TPA: FecR family protein, partial [Verrucomicrobiae bacterium]|nr:FecR family protein [Verrucomicrobiae bacterium]